MEARRAREWSRTKAERQMLKVLGLTNAMAIAFGFALGFVALYLKRPLLMLPLVAALGVFAFVMLRLLDKPLHAIARTRIKYMRGAQGEGLVAWLLTGLEDEWHVFNGMKLEEDWDID